MNSYYQSRAAEKVSSYFVSCSIEFLSKCSFLEVLITIPSLQRSLVSKRQSSMVAFVHLFLGNEEKNNA